MEKFLINGVEVEVERRLTKPLVSMAHTEIFIGRLTSEVKESEMEMEVGGKKGKAQVVECIDLTSGEDVILICNTIMQTSLQKFAPITGNCFAFKAGDIKAGKKYRMIDVYKIKDPESKAAVPAFNEKLKGK